MRLRPKIACVLIALALPLASPVAAFDAETARCVGLGRALADAASMLGVLGDHDARHAEEMALAAALDRTRAGSDPAEQRIAVDAVRKELQPLALAYYRKLATVPGTADDPRKMLDAMLDSCAPLLGP